MDFTLSEGFLVVFVLFFLFIIFKQIQFIVTATNLYKKMIKQQDVMISLLLDIRDNKRNSKSVYPKEPTFQKTDEENVYDLGTNNFFMTDIVKEDSNIIYCDNCKALIKENSKICPQCGISLD